MSTIKLSDVPCETEDKLSRDNEFGRRVTDVLRRISFPDRDKFIISITKDDWMSTGYTLKMYTEVVDIRSGTSMALSHERQLRSDMDDVVLAQELLILMAQYVTHEFMEKFRFEGKVLCDPHDLDRNPTIFNAIEAAVRAKKPEPVAAPTFRILAMDETFFMRHGAEYKSKSEWTVPQKDKVFKFGTWSAKPQKETTPFEKAKAKRDEQKKAFSKFGAKDWRDKKRAA